jgi:uncharacterized lipoprotein YddW (UPF0748 family)
MKFKLLLLALLFAVNNVPSHAQIKREFRGAWIQCVNGQWIGLGTQRMQQTLTHQLDELQRDGVNAIIFQVRAECDALYASPYDPWSRFLTGEQGKAPVPYWDPLAWMVQECHKRGMELHAWINPYRAKTKTTHELANSHVAIQHPDRVFPYDNQFILNPALPENREYICRVAADIVRRYDIDGFHIDDYFYPYPAAGNVIPDDADFQRYNDGFTNRNDWRRHNVDVFMKQLSDSIHTVKPWVKFGVSPFGIFRNKSVSPTGSNTKGLQNYDDLYADVIKWVNEGWCDYCVPQLYWQIGHPTADYKELIQWWNKYAGNRPIYIGEDVERTVKYPDPQNPNSNQQPAKHLLHQQCENVKGTVLWYAKVVVDNIGNYGTNLRNTYWRYPALHPSMPWLDNKAPKKARKLKVIDMGNGPVLFWTAPKAKKWSDEANKFVVYRFRKGQKINLSDPSAIVAVTYQPMLKLQPTTEKCTYVVTSLDRVGNESKGAKLRFAK